MATRETRDATSRQAVRGGAARDYRNRHDPLGRGRPLLLASPSASGPWAGRGARTSYGGGGSWAAAPPPPPPRLRACGGVRAGRGGGIPASNDRDWQPDVAVLATATLDGERVTVHNIRNNAYRTDTDFTPRYYDKTFDLRRLESMDLISSYGAGKAIAHLFVSFGFGGQDYVAISEETRKAQGEEYSTLAGFFKPYTRINVVADERDVIRVRTT